MKINLFRFLIILQLLVNFDFLINQKFALIHKPASSISMAMRISYVSSRHHCLRSIVSFVRGLVNMRCARPRRGPGLWRRPRGGFRGVQTQTRCACR